jgi:uncharacterized tellurite resistance protein B-like protein
MPVLDFFQDQNLTFEHVKTLTAGMFAVARADGVHDREMAMIREFYEGASRAGDPRLEDIVKGGFDVKAAKRLFDTPDRARLFVKSLMLLAFADGTYARAEDELIKTYARELGLTDKDVDQLHESTKEYLLSALSHVQNVEALRKVAAKLDLH